MGAEIYRFTFDREVPLAEVRYSVLLAALAAEGVHGQSQVLMDASYYVDEKKGVCVIDGGTRVGRTVASIFTRFLTREFGVASFSVEHVPAVDSSTGARTA